MLCCDPELNNQPSARTVKRKISEEADLLTGGGGHRTLAEKIIWRLSKHSEELEDEVERRTIDLLDERRRCDAILSRFLPKLVNNCLARYQKITHRRNDHYSNQERSEFSEKCIFW